MSEPDQKRLGVVYGASAFLWWGFAALYFKAVEAAPPLEVLAHRILWSFVAVAALLAGRRRLGATVALLRDGRTLAVMSLTTLLIALNWGLFIWSISVGRLSEASLGYFINPLVNVGLGVVFLGERLRRGQLVAIALAAMGVVWLTYDLGHPPWIALILAASFGTYGLLRKQARPSGLEGLALETGLLAPVALGAMLWWQHEGVLVFASGGVGITGLLMLAGPITALPLVWFAEGARRLRYATMGFLQYLAPTFQFLLAVLAFGEPFTRGHALGFGLIWTALAIYSWDTLRALRAR